MVFSLAFVSLMAIIFRQTLAQSISDVPQCAEKAAFSSISSTGCQLTDVTCICKDQSFINSLLPIVQNECSPADLQKTVAFTESLCNAVGITIAVSTSTPTPTITSIGIPTLFPTTRTVADNQTFTSSVSPLNRSTSTKVITPATASLAPSSESSTSTGVAPRHCARWAWAGTFLGTTLLSLL